eukprot:4007237-Prymnesium_polylepis.1
MEGEGAIVEHLLFVRGDVECQVDPRVGRKRPQCGLALAAGRVLLGLRGRDDALGVLRRRRRLADALDPDAQRLHIGDIRVEPDRHRVGVGQ